MYKVTVTAGGTTAAATKECRTKREAENVKAKLMGMLKMPVTIEISRLESASNDKQNDKQATNDTAVK